MSVSEHRLRRSGFTLVELLVVIAIIGILIALLLPAVQAAREAARRSQCMNNMKQLGLALHNYADVFKKFPPQVYLGGGPVPSGNQTAYHHTWLTSLLPFMEQKPLHDSINFKLPSYGQPIAAAMVPGLLCPSSPTLGDTAASYHGYGVTNYSACEGHELGRYDYPWGDDTAAAIDCAGLVSADYSGIFTVLESNRFADVSDGTSTTVALAETSSVGFKNGGRHGEFKGVIRQVTPGEAVFRSAFIAGMHWGEGAAAPYVRPDGAAPVYGTWFRAAPYMMHPAYITHFHINSEFYGADSAHPLTVNVAMADGSVRTLSQTMDYFTWVIINGKRDGQPTKTEY